MTSASAILCATVFAAAVVSISPAFAQGPDFAGRWVIAGAAMAPWADPLQRGGRAEEARLVGRVVTFGPRTVTGPSPLGCPHAVYSHHDDTADLLFEGELAEPDRAGRPRDAAALARGLGMTTRTVRTMETGCSEVAFHRLAADTLVFGLNNRIYTLHPAGSARP
jgi:hypothetical protein